MALALADPAVVAARQWAAAEAAVRAVGVPSQRDTSVCTAMSVREAECEICLLACRFLVS